MNSTAMLTTVAILIFLYPFLLHFQLKAFKKKLYQLREELEELLKTYNHTVNKEVEEEIHIKRRAYNALVRANNHKLESKISKLLAKKYNFQNQKPFEFQGR